ncbi:MAG: hypothetical protein KC729_20345, partial [Candidatus Eisenbacteria bacterium]|nr:hypothetical protein [Candidatus Eisenbacteria bacterium]
MSGNGHFDWQQVLDRVEGRIPYDAAFWTHLDSCSACAALRTDAEALVDSLLVAGAPEPGAGLMARTWSAILQDAAGRKVRSLVENVRAVAAEVWATLVADSLVPSAAVRGAATASPRLLVYETPEYSVSLSFLTGADRGRTDLVGTVVPKQAPELPAGGSVEVADRTDVEPAKVSEFGEFRFDGIALAEATRL